LGEWVFGILGALYLSQESLTKLNNLLYDTRAQDVDNMRLGLLFNCPLTQNIHQSILETIDVVEDAKERFGTELPHTMMLTSSTTIANVVLIFFDKADEKSTRSAHSTHRQLLKEYQNRGMTPYRLDIDNFDIRGRSDETQKYLAQLKSMFDPDNIIAPTKYNIC
jgi:hypothetical protein